jgi:predicted ABC-type ATPase
LAVDQAASGKKILIPAGPNGAGKTTFAREFLPNEADCPLFVNADLIAAGLSPFAPEQAERQAGRIMLERITELADRGESFAFETTLAGRAYSRRIPAWQARGYDVTLYYLSLSSPETALQRVARRVSEGGHDVPEEVIRRRFLAGRRHFDEIYGPLFDRWILYDNSGPAPVLLDWGEKS